MNYDLRERIAACLKRHDAEMMASEIAITCEAHVDDVRTELRILVSENRVERIHSTQGILRYVIKRRIRQADTLDGQSDSLVASDVADVVAKLRVIAGDTDPLRKLNSLHLLGTHIAAHLNSALNDAASAAASLQSGTQS